LIHHNKLKIVLIVKTVFPPEQGSENLTESGKPRCYSERSASLLYCTTERCNARKMSALLR